MKKLFLILAAAWAMCSTADAQFLKNVLNSAKATAEKSVEKQVDKKVEEGVNKIFNPKTGKYEEAPKTQQQPAATTNQSSGWICLKCGKMGNTGKFCSDCGAPRPESGNGDTWTCTCGHQGNTGNFCAECGAKRPAADGTASAEEVVPSLPQVTMPEVDTEALANSYASQMAALQALGTLTQEELTRLLQLGQQLDKLTDEQAEAFMMAHPDELAFILSLQMKMLGGNANAGK